MIVRCTVCLLVALLTVPTLMAQELGYVQYPGVSADKTSERKQVVLVCGDEFYRSEEVIPQLAKILATHHGFDCSSHFPVNPKTGLIDPNYQDNIPGLQMLRTADLLVIFTRFRNLPDSQMKEIDVYLKRGGAVVGIRPAHHAIRSTSVKWGHYNSTWGPSFKGVDRKGGFGGVVFGQDGCGHLGKQGVNSTQGYANPSQRAHPILRGIADGDIWGPSETYTSNMKQFSGCTPIVFSRCLQPDKATPIEGVLSRMRPTDPPDPGLKQGTAVAWTRTYQVEGGEPGRAFYSSMGVSVDFLSPGTRRLLVNAVYWAMGMEADIPQGGSVVDIVGLYNPTVTGRHGDDYWKSKAMRIADLRLLSVGLAEPEKEREGEVAPLSEKH